MFLSIFAIAYSIMTACRDIFEVIQNVNLHYIFPSQENILNCPGYLKHLTLAPSEHVLQYAGVICIVNTTQPQSQKCMAEAGRKGSMNLARPLKSPLCLTSINYQSLIIYNPKSTYLLKLQLSLLSAVYTYVIHYISLLELLLQSK